MVCDIGSVCNIRVNGPVAGDTLFLISINIDLIEHVKQLNMHNALDFVLCVWGFCVINLHTISISLLFIIAYLNNFRTCGLHELERKTV